MKDTNVPVERKYTDRDPEYHRYDLKHMVGTVGVKYPDTTSKSWLKCECGMIWNKK